MKRWLWFLLVLLLLIALLTFYTQGWDQGLLLLLLFGFSARAYRLAEDFRQEADRESYDRQMRIVHTFTLVCALLSFYWPESLLQNASIFVCLVLHCVINRYVKDV